MKTVLMSRGPLTYQWRPCLAHGAKPRPMDYDRTVNQLAHVTGVPDELGNGALMRLMAQTLWAPGSEVLTEIRFEQLGLGKGILGPARASLKDAPAPHTAGEVTP